MRSQHGWQTDWFNWGPQSGSCLTPLRAITFWADILTTASCARRWFSATSIRSGRVGRSNECRFGSMKLDRAFGPGVFDMKASLAIFLAVIEELKKNWGLVPRPIWVLFTSDEEIGSPTSRVLIEQLAAECAYVLVLEPALADGGLKTSRKGVGRFRLEVEGKAAHAGVAPQEGRSAIVELARQILKLQTMQDIAAGTTINVGVIEGGTTPNVVPARAAAEIDVRVASLSEESRIISAFSSLASDMEGIRLEMSGSFNRPPMERTAASMALFERVQEIGRSLGLELTEGSSGGGSDGNFTAALGVPTLDGLGARGGAPMPTTST